MKIFKLFVAVCVLQVLSIVSIAAGVSPVLQQIDLGVTRAVGNSAQGFSFLVFRNELVIILHPYGNDRQFASWLGDKFPNIILPSSDFVTYGEPEPIEGSFFYPSRASMVYTRFEHSIKIPKGRITGESLPWATRRPEYRSSEEKLAFFPEIETDPATGQELWVALRVFTAHGNVMRIPMTYSQFYPPSSESFLFSDEPVQHLFPLRCRLFTDVSIDGETALVILSSERTMQGNGPRPEIVEVPHAILKVTPEGIFPISFTGDVKDFFSSSRPLQELSIWKGLPMWVEGLNDEKMFSHQLPKMPNGMGNIQEFLMFGLTTGRQGGMYSGYTAANKLLPPLPPASQFYQIRNEGESGRPESHKVPEPISNRVFLDQFVGGNLPDEEGKLNRPKAQEQFRFRPEEIRLLGEVPGYVDFGVAQFGRGRFGIVQVISGNDIVSVASNLDDLTFAPWEEAEGTVSRGALTIVVKSIIPNSNEVPSKGETVPQRVQIFPLQDLEIKTVPSANQATDAKNSTARFSLDIWLKSCERKLAE